MTEVKFQEPVTVERIERGLSLLAYFIERDGDVLVPLYEKLERELEDRKRTNAAMARARLRLQTNSFAPVVPCRQQQPVRGDAMVRYDWPNNLEAQNKLVAAILKRLLSGGISRTTLSVDEFRPDFLE